METPTLIKGHFMYNKHQLIKLADESHLVLSNRTLDVVKSINLYPNSTSEQIGVRTGLSINTVKHMTKNLVRQGLIKLTQPKGNSPYQFAIRTAYQIKDVKSRTVAYFRPGNEKVLLVDGDYYYVQTVGYNILRACIDNPSLLTLPSLSSLTGYSSPTICIYTKWFKRTGLLSINVRNEWVCKPYEEIEAVTLRKY